MSSAAARLLRFGLVFVACGAAVLAAVFTSRTFRKAWHLSTLPAGYEEIGEYPPWVLYARPGNRAGHAAARILSAFTHRVVAELGRDLDLHLPAEPCHVFVFSDERDLREYTRDQLGSDYAFNGGFYIGVWRAVGVVGHDDPGELVGPLFHEGTHLLLDLSGDEPGRQEWSRWLTEGLASWFQASEVDGEGRIVRLGGMLPVLRERLQRALLAGRWPVVRDLLAAGKAEFTGEDNLLWYGHSALLAHYYLSGEAGRRERFLRYLAEERRPGPSGEGTFREILGDPEALDEELRRHVLSLG